MIKKCVNCGAAIDKTLDKCPCCGTPYKYSGFCANFDSGDAFGTIEIAGKIYQVYLGDCEVHEVKFKYWAYESNKLVRHNDIKQIRKFTLIEV